MPTLNGIINHLLHTLHLFLNTPSRGHFVTIKIIYSSTYFFKMDTQLRIYEKYQRDFSELTRNKQDDAFYFCLLNSFQILRSQNVILINDPLT